MPTSLVGEKRTRPKFCGKRGKDRLGAILGLDVESRLELADRIKLGLPYSAFRAFRKFSDYSAEQLAGLVHVPARTLARRKLQGRLSHSESERLWRLAAVFDKAVALFDGDVSAARRWLELPCRAFGEIAPLTLCETEIGAREVEDLIGRLEHGVFS